VSWARYRHRITVCLLADELDELAAEAACEH
jgi:hypothetical protein